MPFPESALNEEAGRLFMESYDDYHNQAKIYTNIHAKPNAKQLEVMNSLGSKSKAKASINQDTTLDAQLNNQEQKTISLFGSENN